MARPKKKYVCSQCGAQAGKWTGKCSSCGDYDTMEEKVERQGLGSAVSVSSTLRFESLDAVVVEHDRQTTGLHEFDRATGGGIVPGSAILIGGDPGIGKSTLLLQAAAWMSENSDNNIYYVSGEESSEQIRMRARRLGVTDTSVHLAQSNDCQAIEEVISKAGHGDLMIVDSIQTMSVQGIDSAPGTISTVRSVGHRICEAAKRTGCSVIFVAHVTKEGNIAGPRVIEHLVDCVLMFDTSRTGPGYRILRANKNRFGTTDEVGVFVMTSSGLEDVVNPSETFLSERREGVAGSAVFPSLEGTRPLLVEVQALVSDSDFSTPVRTVVGWDKNRLQMIIAILKSRAGIDFSNKDIYLNIAGGFKINETGTDLAVAAALLSSLKDMPLPPESAWFGELGLGGEIRSVPRPEARINECSNVGFPCVYMPQIEGQKESSNLVTISGVLELLAHLAKYEISMKDAAE